jgi:Rieske Fe-S protein
MDAAPDETPGRRRFLGGVLATIQAVIAGTVGTILGGAVVAPALAQREESWLPAGPVDDLPAQQPTPVTLRIARRDGYAEVVDRHTVFLVRNDDGQVTVFDSTCTHLGCRVGWAADTAEFKCPCHGGVFDVSGAVKAGPPPAPLSRLTARVEDGQVLVRV